MSKLFDVLSSMIQKINVSVKTTSQTLTEDQKVQARSNIDATKKFVVTVTPNEVAEGEDQTYSADHTVSEILEAYGSGCVIALTCSVENLNLAAEGSLLALDMNDDNPCVIFKCDSLSESGIYIVIDNDGVIVQDCSSTLYVTLTLFDGSDAKVTCDYSYGEIKSAYDSGHVIVATMYQKTIPVGISAMSHINNQFAAYMIDMNHTVRLVYVNSDGCGVYTCEAPSSLKNPFALKIDDKTYDGSSEVDVTLPKAYYVEVINNGDGTGTVSKSYDELKSAYESGNSVVAVLLSSESSMYSIMGTAMLCLNENKITGTASILDESGKSAFAGVVIDKESVTIRILPNNTVTEVDGQTGSVSSVAVYPVLFTLGEDNKVSCDLTVEEIASAASKGKVVIGILSNGIGSNTLFQLNSIIATKFSTNLYFKSSYLNEDHHLIMTSSDSEIAYETVPIYGSFVINGNTIDLETTPDITSLIEAIVDSKMNSSGEGDPG